MDIEAVEVGEKAKVLEGWGGFRGELEAFSYAIVEVASNGFVAAGTGEVIDLAEEKNLFAVDGGGVDRFVMCSSAEAKFW